MSGFAAPSKADERAKDFKKSTDLESSRLRREETTVQIRKTKKDDRLNKRRQMTSTPTPAPGAVPLGHPSTGIGMPSATDQQRLDALPQMVAGVMSFDVAAQTEYTTQFRRLLSIEKNPPIQQVIDAGVVPRFVEFLGADANPALQFEAAWALTNIASGTSQHTQVVMNHGAVPIFCRLLASPNDDVREQAVWALGNIAGDSPDCRNNVLAVGAMPHLLAQLQNNSKMSMLRNATWTLSNFCRGKPQPDFSQVKPCLPTLAQLVYSPDEEVLTDACWALSYLSDGPNDKIQAVIDTGVPRRLVDLLMHAQPSVQTPALRTVGNIVTGTDVQTQTIINFNALGCLHALLSSHKKGIRKEACWTISNITAGTDEQIQSVIAANIIPQLIQLLRNAEFDIRKESAWAISNATSGGTREQIKYLVHQGCIGPLCDLLKVQDTKIITVALEGLENILKVGDKEMKEKGLPRNEFARYIEEAEGLSKIEDLQHHENDDIYNKVIKILSEYFEVDEEEGDAALAPEVQGNQFTFGAQPGAPTSGGFNFS